MDWKSKQLAFLYYGPEEGYRSCEVVLLSEAEEEVARLEAENKDLKTLINEGIERLMKITGNINEPALFTQINLVLEALKEKDVHHRHCYTCALNGNMQSEHCKCEHIPVMKEPGQAKPDNMGALNPTRCSMLAEASHPPVDNGEGKTSRAPSSGPETPAPEKCCATCGTICTLGECNNYNKWTPKAPAKKEDE